MTIKLKDLKKEMKTGKNLVGTYAPPKFLYRDANSYTELPIIPKTLELVPKKLDSDVSDLDFIGVIKSEYPNRKKPKGSNSKEVGPSYRVTIKFIGVKFSETKDGVHTEEVIFKKKKLYFKKPSLNNNPAKIRCQCFTGDTLIPLANGNSVEIKDLVGKEFYIYSFNEATKKMEIAKATNCEAKREDYIYHVTLDNGHVVKCTGDHKFLTRDGNWVEAKDLTEGVSLEPLYRKLSTKKDDHKRIGYEMVYQTHYNNYDFTHVLSDECNLREGLQNKEQGDTRHHVDFNKLKNDNQYNHKVVSVTKTDKVEMTYCFTVEGNHNFAIDVGNNEGTIVKNCADFRHKFETPIAQAGALAYGTPRPYIRKTAIPTDANFAKWEKGELDQKPMPYANPTEKLGYCKHIHSFLAYLMDAAKLVKS